MHVLFLVLLLALTCVRSANAMAAEAEAEAEAPQAHEAGQFMSMGEMRGQSAESREEALEDASVLAEEACDGHLQVVGTKTAAVSEGFVADLWYLCTSVD